ncbi:Soa1 protein [Martiniozyma asiatica (nom. inval.)]|nr:Soa1 protein [Martiniozyma asiatica]
MSEKQSIDNTSTTSSSNSKSSKDLEITILNDLAIPIEEKNAKVDALAKEYGIDHKKLMHKIDLCVVPPFCLLYFLAFLDRVNISNANIYGMSKSLDLSSTQFSAALTVFFVPYIVFEIVSNYLLKFIKPHIWLSAMIFLFGIVTICMAWAKNYGGLITCRLFLGIFEAGSFPSIFYIMSNFYNSRESQRRFSIFFSCTCLAGGCAGALAYRIHDLDGVHGLHSWQWIYVIEGSFTAGLAFLLYFIVPDFPEQCRFLNQNEREFIKKKLEIYAGASGFEVKQTFKDVLKVLKDPVIYICAIAYFCFIVPAYSYAFFAPTIIKELGYVAMEAQRHSIYPWLASMGFSILLAFISDYFHNRIIFGVISGLISIVGYAIIMGCPHNADVKYAGMFLAAMGLYTAMPILMCWISLNFNGHIRKSVGTAFFIGFGNIGGIVASFLFPTKDSPLFTTGMGVGVAFSALGTLMMCVYCGYLAWKNKVKKSQEYIAHWDSLDDREKVMGGDLHPDFKYLY